MLRHHGLSGTCLLLCGLSPILSVPLHSARAETVLYAFCQQQNCKDGEFPGGGVIRTKAGNLVGTAFNGGANGAGAVFQIAPDGTETVLHSFATGSDGADPGAGLLEDSAGNLFGTTEFGGTSGNGTVFELAPDGTETVWSIGSWGFGGQSTLVMDRRGNLYGSSLGGTDGFGVIFRLSPKGAFKSLYNFTGGSDGGVPSSVIRDANGNLYGTAGQGGNFGGGCDGNGCGAVFKLTPDGTETVLYAFAAGNDGIDPAYGVIRDGAGNLYGTTAHGGSGSAGIVFKVAPDGTETVLYTFTGGNDGNSPQGGLIMDSAGNLYGTTGGGGGQNGNGVVFKLTPDGTETVLHTFTGGSDGANPGGSLFLHRRTLYGTTSEGGVNSAGTVYKLAK